MTGLIRPEPRARLACSGIAPDDPEELVPRASATARSSTPSRAASPAAQFVRDCAARCTASPEREARARWPSEALERVGHDRGRRPQGGRLQQGHAAAHPAGAGDRAPTRGAGARRAAQRPRPDGARRDRSRSSEGLGERGPARDRLEPHPARGRPDLRPGGAAQRRLRRGRGRDPRRAQRGRRSTRCRSWSAATGRRCWPRACSTQDARGRGASSTTTARACWCARATPTASTGCSTAVVLEDELELEAVAPADDDVSAVYQYLIGSDAEARDEHGRRAARSGTPLWRRQVLALLRLELRRRASRAGGSLWLFFLAFAPPRSSSRATRCDDRATATLEEETLILAGIMQVFYVRVGDLLRLPGHLHAAAARRGRRAAPCTTRFWPRCGARC